jgi:predicted DNA repair protein MutK
MAGSSLLALLDDIATVLDDVALLTKVATRKTAGVLGDDLALNAEQVSGVRAERELPVVWAVAKGSAVNKLILVPAALAISAFAPWAVVPLLMAGGLFLCYEGFEKVAHKLVRTRAEDADEHAALTAALADPAADLVALEKQKIRGAIRTDFVLSAEIVVITLGIVAAAPFVTRVAVLSGIAALMTVGVYGLVAGIVKLDDAGLHLSRRAGDGTLARFQRAVGAGILRVAPYLMKALSIVGTAAMFLVGGGILVHGVPAAQRWIEHAAERAGALPYLGGTLEAVGAALAGALVGIVAGGLAFGAMALVRKVWPARQESAA